MDHKKPLKSRIVFVIVFALDILMIAPACYYTFNYEKLPFVRSIYEAIAQTIDYFKFKGAYGTVSEFMNIMPESLAGIYSVVANALYIISPIVTVTFILSFFYKVRAYNNIFLKRNRDTYIFSDVNDRSLTLAKSIKENHPKSLIVFANAKNEETRQKTKDIGYCISKSMDSLDIIRRGKAKVISFFAINDSEEENIKVSLKVTEKFGDMERARLYSFVSSAESEMVLSSNKDRKIKVRRVNKQRALIYRYLYENGKSVFDNARDGKICICICGMGQYGRELLKSMAWYCQMPGYEIEIHAFDSDGVCTDRFKAACPELMDEKHNGTSIPGEAQYKIVIHDKCDIYGQDFSKEISKINPTDVFVCLGNDENNVACAINIRKLLEKDNMDSRIQMFIYESGKIDRIENAVNYSGKSYNLKCIGAPENEYTEEVIIDSQLEKLALERHLQWGDERSFWEYEFNYDSSEASAISIKARQELKITDTDTVQQYEHRRWNAYMRTEGYCYSGSREKNSKNTIAKLHPDLVPFDELTKEDKMKDF